MSMSLQRQGSRCLASVPSELQAWASALRALSASLLHCFTSSFGSCCSHTGLEVYGSEHVFAGGETASSGIYSQVAWISERVVGASNSPFASQRPRTQPAGSPWKYKQSLELGRTPATKTEVKVRTLHSLSRSSTTVLASHCQHRLAQRIGPEH